MTKVTDLRPNKELLEPDFQGYKLSLQEINRTKEKIPSGVHRIHANNDQYSYKHAKLFGSHNHLTGENLNGTDYIYFIDTLRKINKTSLEPYSTSLSENRSVWKVPNVNPSSDYNITLKLPSENIAVVADGAGNLYILETKTRHDNTEWKSIQSHDFPFSFVLQDCKFDVDGNLRCLLFGIVFEDNKHFSVLHRIVLNSSDWSVVKSTRYKSKGEMSCAFLEGDDLLVAATDTFGGGSLDSVKKLYVWVQNDEKIQIRLKISERNVIVETSGGDFKVAADGEVVLNGKLSRAIRSDRTTWFVSQGILNVELIKSESDVWDELIEGDDRGELVLDADIANAAHEKLAHLCSDEEIKTSQSILNTDQMEECDFPSSSDSIIERINADDDVTQRVHLGGSQILFTTFDNKYSPILILQQNEDACLWKCESFEFVHVGTLMALGYIQASKQRKKYIGCAPDLNYAIICDANRHLFIYRQNKRITSGELRNRKDCKRVLKVAQQQVIDLTEEEVLGLYCTDKTLYILSEHYVHALHMNQ